MSKTLKWILQVDAANGTAAIRQVGKATKDLTKDKKELEKQVKSVGASISSLTSHIGGLKGIMAGAGVGYIAKQFLDAARTTENLSIRMEVLTGSVSEGARMFQLMSAYAAKVPFEYEQIMGAATQLSGVLKGSVDEVNRWIPLIGDLAASQGLSIDVATEQVSRMMSAGAASADLFRERGTLAFLGFQAGVSYSAEETRQMLMNAWLEPESRFRGATDKMAQSWDGLMSMLGDKWFAFRNQLLDAEAFATLKGVLAGVVDSFDATANAAIRMAKVLMAGGAAYLAITGLPVIASSAATAVNVLRLSIAGLFTDQMTLRAGAFSTALFGVKFQVSSLTTAMGLLRTVTLGAFAAFAGWQLGKWLSDEFEAVRVAGVGMVGALNRGWIETRYGAETAWTGIKSAFFAVVDSIRNAFAGLMEDVTKMLNKLGFEDRAYDVWHFAQQLKSPPREEFKAALDGVLKEREDALRQHQETVDAMLAENAMKVSDLAPKTPGQQATGKEDTGKAAPDNTAKAAMDAYIKLQEEARDRIAQLTLNETDYKILQLNRWKDAAVKIATAAGQETTAIEQAFALEMAELNQQTAAQEAAAWLEGEAAFAAHQQRLADMERTALEQRANLQTELEGRLIELTEGRFEYQRHLLEQETADLLAKYETDKEMADLVAAYKIAKLDEIAQAERASQQTSLQIAQEIAGGIAGAYQDMAQAGADAGQAGFEAYKAFATAQALISTYEGATKAYAAMAGIPVVGPALGAAAATAAVVAGMARVAIIQGTKPAKKHAEGGVFDTAHMGIIGEAGKEAILPLSEKYRQQGQAIFNEIAPTFLPGYAKGMLATSPHVGLVGEAGPEAIMPLDRGMIPVDFVGNAAVVQLPNATVPLRIPAYAAGGLVGGRPAAAVSPSMSRNSSININLDLSGNTFVDQGAMDVFIENIATRVSHVVAREVAVDAVTQDYANDGPTRRMILGGYDG